MTVTPSRIAIMPAASHVPMGSSRDAQAAGKQPRDAIAWRPTLPEKIMSLLGLVILAATAAPDAAIANPLAPGLAGQLECSKPNEQKKTCRSLASYQRVGTGYSNSAIILISPNGPVTMEITAPVTMKGNAYCGIMRAEQLNAARIRVAGQVLGEEQAAPIHAAILAAFAPMMGKEICDTHQVTPTGLIEKATIDGVYEPKADVPIKWVAPGDGYSVAP
jgi:hypothetical protein